MILRIIPLIIICNVLLVNAYPQIYNVHDSLALIAIDETCDAFDSLNWNTESDPGNWKGVIWTITNPKKVKELWIDNNNLSGTLQITQLDSLTDLYCPSNQLTEIQVADLPGLKYLSCYYNNLTHLDLSNLGNIINLNCRNNYLTTLDVINLESLHVLNCSENQIQFLNVSGMPNLSTLECYYNQLNSLELRSLPKIAYLDCSGNRLSLLDISDINSLEQLFCNDNLLTSLDLSASLNLEILWCDGNQITDLDVSSSSELFWIYCSFNQLTSLDFSMLVKLDMLTCSNNRLPFSSLATCLQAEDLFEYSPQDTLYEPTAMAGDFLMDYSSEANINGTSTQFVFYKDQEAQDTNITGLFNTEGPGIYHCEMTNALFPGLTLITAPVTIWPLGIDGKEQRSIGIYPNPVTDILNLDVPFDTYEIEICNVEGRTLIEAVNASKIDMSGYHAGVYYIRVRSEDEVWVGRTVKK